MRYLTKEWYLSLQHSYHSMEWKKIMDKCDEIQNIERSKINNNEIFDNYYFHDCKVTDIKKDGNDIIIKLYNKDALSLISEITYIDAEIIEDEGALNSWWLNEELYSTDIGYEAHSLLDYCHDEGENELRYLTIKCKDIKYKFNDDKGGQDDRRTIWLKIHVE